MAIYKKVLRISGELFRRFPAQFLFLFILLVLEGAIAASSVLTVIPLADYMVDPTLSKPSQITTVVTGLLSAVDVPINFWSLGSLFIISNFLKAFFDVAIRYSVLIIKYSVVERLFSEALALFFNARWTFFSNSDQGKLLNTLNKELGTIGDALENIATTSARMVQLCIYLILPIWLSPEITLTALAISIVFSIPFIMLHKVSYKLGIKNAETSNRSMGILNEILSSAKLILSYGRQESSRDLFINSFRKHINVTLRSQTLGLAAPRLFYSFTIMAAIFAMGLFAHEQKLSELAAVMWSLLGALPILSSLLGGNIGISYLLPSYEQLESLCTIAKSQQETFGGKGFTKLEKNIIVDNVSFSYPGRYDTIKNLSLKIEKGQMVALIGESGSGKSTVADLILGLQVPSLGHISVDGVLLEELDKNSYRRHVGYVPQDPQLFNDSIKNNLLWSEPQASENEIWEALLLANARDFVDNLPNGINTIVGDRGVRLSGGQRQRIALARALIKRPELLILDEATSALDMESERLIKMAIGELAHKTTMLVIAHRLTTIIDADKVCVMDHGKLLEEGSFAQLTANPTSRLSKMLAASAFIVG